ncbi:hypothetical protein ABI043_13260, partial [Enterococcus faecium]
IGNPSLNHRYRKGFYSLFKTLQQNLENLQEQLHLTYTEETPTTESTAFSEKKADNTQPLIEKKWWQIWKSNRTNL